MNTIRVDVVSAEEAIFSGEARFVALPGEAGELGIYPRHTPLITRIRPGSVRIEMADGSEEFVFVAGGILEVQPHCVTVLSDTAIRGKDLDEEKANTAKAAAEAAARAGLGAEIAALAGEKAFARLRAPVVRLGGPDAPAAASYPLEQAFAPSAEAIAAAARRLCT